MRTTSPVAWSICSKAWSVASATHRPAPPTATAEASAPPRRIVCVTPPLSTSIRESVPVSVLATQIARRPTVTLLGCPCTGMRSTTLPLEGSTRRTSCELDSAIQTAPGPTAMAAGAALSASTVCTAPERAPIESRRLRASGVGSPPSCPRIATREPATAASAASARPPSAHAGGRLRRRSCARAGRSSRLSCRRISRSSSRSRGPGSSPSSPARR